MRCAAFLALAGLALAASDQTVIVDELEQVAAKVNDRLRSKLAGMAVSPSAVDADPDPTADQLTHWIVRPADARPARDGPVDWPAVQDLDMEVSLIDWESGFTPANAGLEAGASNATVEGKAYGTSSASYADSRFGNDLWAASKPVGRLLFNIGTTTYACSATLIGKSLLLTAAHCVFKYGANSATGYYTNFRFYPQLGGNNVAPYGFWSWQAAMVPRVYYAGTDTCTARGVVCNNDLALIWLQPTGSTIANQAGVALGYYPYSWNGYSFMTPSSTFSSIFGNKPYVAITQLGYPAAFDSGQTMQMSNSPGYQYATTSTTNSKKLMNLMRGTSLTGGSSGGPWIVNFGVDAVLSGISLGSDALRNAVAAVTSWGYTDRAIKVQGASWFGQNNEFTDAAYGTRGAGNIGKLVYDACDNAAISDWQMQSKGYCT